jgi:ABC-type enterochelin transport system substrate-binding protein
MTGNHRCENYEQIYIINLQFLIASGYRWYLKYNRLTRSAPNVLLTLEQEGEITRKILTECRNSGFQTENLVICTEIKPVWSSSTDMT